MIIALNSDWRIRSDPLQWIVDQRHVRKPGTPDEYAEWKGKMVGWAIMKKELSGS